MANPKYFLVSKVAELADTIEAFCRAYDVAESAIIPCIELVQGPFLLPGEVEDRSAAGAVDRYPAVLPILGQVEPGDLVQFVGVYAIQGPDGIYIRVRVVPTAAMCDIRATTLGYQDDEDQWAFVTVGVVDSVDRADFLVHTANDNEGPWFARFHVTEDVHGLVASRGPTGPFQGRGWRGT